MQPIDYQNTKKKTEFETFEFLDDLMTFNDLVADLIINYKHYKNGSILKREPGN